MSNKIEEMFDLYINHRINEKAKGAIDVIGILLDALNYYARGGTGTDRANDAIEKIKYHTI